VASGFTAKSKRQREEEVIDLDTPEKPAGPTAKKPRLDAPALQVSSSDFKPASKLGGLFSVPKAAPTPPQQKRPIDISDSPVKQKEVISLNDDWF
jgi:hypothetical protein